MKKFSLSEKKGVFICKDEYYREVKLFASPNSEISAETFALGMTVIEPGKRHEEHVHDTNKEIMVIYEGEGILLSKGEKIHVKKDDVMGFDYNEPHGFINTGDVPLKILWIYHPPGLAEEKFLTK